MNLPQTKPDLEALVATSVQESVHLDYKDSRALTSKHAADDLSKDVSAFANADGGVLVYGIREQDHLPIALDGGVENGAISREWIEQILTSNISPRIEGLRISQIPLSPTHSGFSIAVPKSYRGPHQDRATKRYYKRHNFKSLPMEDYEISDLRSRARSIVPLVSFDVEVRHGFLFLFVISNRGEFPAGEVRFEFSPEPTWESAPPPLVLKGIDSLPPGREYRVFYRSAPDVLGDDPKSCAVFTAVTTYFHPVLGQRISETYSINLGDYLGTWASSSPVEELGKTLEKELRDIRSSLKAIQGSLEKLTSVAGPTGIEVSVRSLRELVGSLGHEARLEKRPADQWNPGVFQEVLGIEFELAYRISRHLLKRNRSSSLEDIEGMTPELAERVRELFWVRE